MVARLLDPGEWAVDAGAHVGYMTSLMAVVVRPGGRVIAFEPHPTVFAMLSRNVARWTTEVASIDVREEALSDRNGYARLSIPPEFPTNMGTASLQTMPESNHAGVVGQVQTVRLDDVLEDHRLGLLKVDVEGHEAKVLAGAERALDEHRVRDIVFEELTQLPTPVTELLGEKGYTLFAPVQRLRGVDLADPEQPGVLPSWEAPTYLATLEPERARMRMTPRGWTVLRGRLA